MRDFIPQNEPLFEQEDIDAVNRYMNSGGFITEYKETERLERMLAEFTGSRYCSLMCNGTVTLLSALEALDMRGGRVLVPDYTMLATASVVNLSGATPIIADVEPNTLCISLEEIKRVCRNTSVPDAIMLVSINGRYPLDIDETVEFCHDNDIRIIEDAAQSLGSIYNKKHVGTLGEIGSFSLSTPKIISTGQGGFLVTNDKSLYEKIEMIKDFGRPERGVDKHKIIGYNFKYTDIQAVVGIEQLKKMPKRVARKKELYYLYRDLLDGSDSITLYDNSQNTPWMIDVSIKEGRDIFISELKKRGIGSRPFYPALTRTEPYFSQPNPNALYASEHGVWLPSSLKLTDDDVRCICGNIREVL